MKILKIFGVVVGIHVFALILIFANPGCSSTTPPPAAADTAAKTDAPPPTVGVAPMVASEVAPVSIASAPPASFDPNAPATAGAAVRFTPTRPNTPAASQLEAEPVADVTPATTYTVGKGDSLWSIAKKYHINRTDLAAVNNLKPSSIVRPGQKLIIPAKTPPAGTTAGHTAVDKAPGRTTTASAASTPAPATTTGPRGETRHKVQPGETLGGIAHKYHVKMGDISVANNISDPKKIRPGMELIIPGAAGAAPAKTSASTNTLPPSTSPVTAVPADSPVQPAPEGDLDAGVKSKTAEPPVIKIDDSSTPQK
ncbi:MAG TPA: LysM peptidoglycan-binding domain-containing protein [Candidatus Limnocylindrales bacterium]